MPFSPLKLQLDDLALFVRIAELGTLSAAARERNAPVSQVTRALTRLETACAVRLIHRSTHGLRLSDEGQTLLAYAQRVGDTTRRLAEALGGPRGAPSGRVRVGVSPLLADCLVAPSLTALSARYPLLRLDIRADDRVTDLVQGDIDIAIRNGDVGSDTLVARPIGEHGRGLYAAPAYVTTFGLPRDVAALAGHRLVGNTGSPALGRWTLPAARGGLAPEALPVHTRADNSALVGSLVLAGVGIGQLNDLFAMPHVQGGRLVRVLADATPGPRIPIYAVMQPDRHRLPRLRACIDFWRDWLHDIGHGVSPESSSASR